MTECPHVPQQFARCPARFGLAGLSLDGVMRDEMKSHYLAPCPDQPAILGLCMMMALALGPQVFAHQSRALRDRPDQQAALAGFAGPALVLMGAEDRFSPLDRPLSLPRSSAAPALI